MMNHVDIHIDIHIGIHIGIHIDIGLIIRVRKEKQYKYHSVLTGFAGGSNFPLDP